MFRADIGHDLNVRHKPRRDGCDGRTLPVNEDVNQTISHVDVVSRPEDEILDVVVRVNFQSHTFWTKSHTAQPTNRQTATIAMAD